MKIKIQLSIFALVLVSVCIFCLSIVFYIIGRQYLLNKSKENLATVCENFGQVCRDALVTNDELLILNFSKSLSKSIKGVAYAAFIYTNDKILLIADDEIKGFIINNKANTNKGKFFNNIYINYLPPLKNQKIIEIALPISSGKSRSGICRVGFFKEIIDADINAVIIKMRNYVIISAFGILVFALFLVILISDGITKPIYVLAEDAKLIGAGKLDTKIEVKTKNEIGELANCFNSMMDKLKQMTVSRDELINEIAERRKVEEELEKHKNHLEELVALRAGELVAVNEELDSYTYTVSHDLKEPLRGVETFSRFMLEDYSDKIDDTGKDYLKRISAGAERMKNLIDDLLALSRISRIKNPYQSVDSKKLVDEAIKRLKILLEEKNVKIVIDDELPFIYCDPIKMKEVFYNLISNAMKYNDSKEPVVEVGVKDEAFFVKDNGIGIKKEHFDLIFEMFRRLHSREEYSGGTGAGLAIVKKIIEGHGGKIWVESEEGKGTTFFFSIPKIGETKNGKGIKVN